MTTPASQVQLIESPQDGGLTELIVLDAPGAQIQLLDLSDSNPLPLGTAAAGTSGDASRADHVHAHGNQAGGLLHAAATSGAAGFMSSADKVKLDAATSASTPNTLVLRDGTGSFDIDDGSF